MVTGVNENRDTQSFERITIRRPDDFHVHLRQGDMLANVVGLTGATFSRALVMPNTVPPILTAADARRYKAEIEAHATPGLQLLMTIKLTGATTPQIVRDARAAGVIAGKLYPEGVTTNSSDGVRDFDDLWPVFAAMQEAGMVLCLHGELPGVFTLDREREFLTVFAKIVAAFPTLRIVLEHVSTREAVEYVRDRTPATVAATITVHHLMLTLDDIIGDMLEPHHFCKPVAKTPDARAALVEAAVSGNRKFFLGTDSAPHLREKKEVASGCAGVFTATVALPLLAEIFEREGALDKLEAFTSMYGAEFYELPLNEGRLTMTREPWTVPAEYAGVVPLWAGKTVNWRVTEASGLGRGQRGPAKPSAHSSRQ